MQPAVCLLPPLIVPRSAANIRFVFREVTLSIALLKSSCMMRSFELIFNLVNFSQFLRLACTVEGQLALSYWGQQRTAIGQSRMRLRLRSGRSAARSCSSCGFLTSLVFLFVDLGCPSAFYLQLTFLRSVQPIISLIRVSLRRWIFLQVIRASSTLRA